MTFELAKDIIKQIHMMKNDKMGILFRRVSKMNFRKSLELMEKYSKCQKCGSEYIGDGEGTLVVTDDTFIRTCKCGWRVEIKEE